MGQLLWTLAQLGAPCRRSGCCGFLPGFLFKVQSFGLSFGPGEKETDGRRSSRNSFKPSIIHPVVATTSQIFFISLLSKYSFSWIPPIFTLSNHNKIFAIDFWLLLPIKKLKLKEMMMAFVYKQNLVYIYSLHLIAKFINIDQAVLIKPISCF